MADKLYSLNMNNTVNKGQNKDVYNSPSLFRWNGTEHALFPYLLKARANQVLCQPFQDVAQFSHINNVLYFLFITNSKIF